LFFFVFKTPFDSPAVCGVRYRPKPTEEDNLVQMLITSA